MDFWKQVFSAFFVYTTFIIIPIGMQFNTIHKIYY